MALLDVKGCLISIDAMGCQTEIASTIVKSGGDYLLAVKGNQPTLHNAVRAALAESAKAPLSAKKRSVSRKRTVALMAASIMCYQPAHWQSNFPNGKR